jgi:hypothetical protein
LEALTSLETTLQAALGLAALAVAAWNAARNLSHREGAAKTGEIAWTAVAVAVLAGVSLAAGIGRGV